MPEAVPQAETGRGGAQNRSQPPAEHSDAREESEIEQGEEPSTGNIKGEADHRRLSPVCGEDHVDQEGIAPPGKAEAKSPPQKN